MSWRRRPAGSFVAARSGQRMSVQGRLRPFDVVSSGRSTSLWHRQASSGCFRDFDPANGRRPTSEVPRKPVVGGAIFRLPVRPVMAGTCQRRTAADWQPDSNAEASGVGSRVRRMLNAQSKLSCSIPAVHRHRLSAMSGRSRPAGSERRNRSRLRSGGRRLLAFGGPASEA
jgi:hypothetical protein